MIRGTRLKKRPRDPWTELKIGFDPWIEFRKYITIRQYAEENSLILPDIDFHTPQAKIILVILNPLYYQNLEEIPK